jgi:hypothetical protein
VGGGGMLTCCWAVSPPQPQAALQRSLPLQSRARLQQCVTSTVPPSEVVPVIVAAVALVRDASPVTVTVPVTVAAPVMPSPPAVTAKPSAMVVSPVEATWCEGREKGIAHTFGWQAATKEDKHAPKPKVPMGHVPSAEQPPRYVGASSMRAQ